MPINFGADYWKVTFVVPETTTPGEPSVPQDVLRLRRDAISFHMEYGEPVIYKHRWTEEDVDAGIAQRCPYCRDSAYQQPRQDDPYCFGTGYLGGYDDGIIVFMTFGDATEDVFKINAQGILVRDKHPICTAPWYPDFSDGDLLIQAQIDYDNSTVIKLMDRYLIKETTPVTLRGYRKKVQPVAGLADSAHYARAFPEYKVSQNFQVDHVEKWHPIYNIPYRFDYDDQPSIPTTAPGEVATPVSTAFSNEISILMPVAGVVQKTTVNI